MCVWLNKSDAEDSIDSYYMNVCRQKHPVLTGGITFPVMTKTMGGVSINRLILGQKYIKKP